jgi:ketosteroid isomerase-like protein
VSASGNAQLVEGAFDALATGDFPAAERAFHPAARWRAVEDGPSNCENRRAIMEVLRRNFSAGPGGRIENATDAGERVIVGFRPDPGRLPERPLDDGLAYVVVTVSDGLIVELKGCRDRSSALAYVTDSG